MIPVEEVLLSVNKFEGLIVRIIISCFVCFVADENVAVGFFGGVCLPLSSSSNMSWKFVFWAGANIVFSREDVSLFPKFKGVLEAVQGRRSFDLC